MTDIRLVKSIYEGSKVSALGEVSLSNVIYAQWYGAVGDGVTDDRDAIQAAIDALPEGGTLHIPATSAYYKIDATQLSEALTISTRINIVLDGELRGTSSTNQVNPPYVMNITADGVVLEGRGIIRGVGTYVVNEVTALNVPGLARITGDNVTIRGITFINPPETAVHLIAAHWATIDSCQFTGGPGIATATSPQHYYILISGGGDNIKITENKFYADISGGSARNAICNESSPAIYNMSIINNHFLDIHEHAIYCYVASSNASGNIIRYTQTAANQKGPAIKFSGYWNIINENNIYNALQGAIVVYASVGSIITHNNIYSAANVGIDIGHNTAITTGLNHIEISYNYIEAAATGTITNGIRVKTTATAGIECTAASYAGKIIGNTLVGWGVDTVSYYASLALWGQVAYPFYNFSIKDNVITGSNGYGIYLGAITQGKLSGNIIYNNPMANFRGVYTSGCSKLTIENNLVEDYQGAPTLQYAFYYSTTTDIRMLNNECYGASVASPFGHSVANNILGRGNKTSRTSLSGSFTMNNVAFVDVTNENVLTNTYNSEIGAIVIVPINSAAGSVMGGVSSLYVSGITAATGFRVSTANGGGVSSIDHIFAYDILQ
jgi:parallel beta-helix repeat protein